MLRPAAALLCLALLPAAAHAADAPAGLSATDLAARLNSWQQDGASYVRLRMETKQPPETTKSVLQIQIKAVRTKNTSDVLYQVLWPKEKKGQAVLLRKAKDGSLSGWSFAPPDSLRTLNSSQMEEQLFGSDLSYGDLIENFFAWPNQRIVDADQLDGADCQVLESKPGKGAHSPVASVRTWVDMRRLVPLRIERYNAAGQLVQRIDVTNVATDDIGRQIPANLTISRPRSESVTELDGSRIKHDITYPDGQFTPEALKEVTIPRSSPE